MNTKTRNERPGFKVRVNGYQPGRLFPCAEKFTEKFQSVKAAEKAAKPLIKAIQAKGLEYSWDLLVH